MSRDRNSNDKPKKQRISKISNSGSSRPAASRARAPKKEKPEDQKPAKEAKAREPRLLSQSEAKSYEKTFDRPVYRKPAGKRTGKSFDKSAKFVKGDGSARPTKLFKNYERPQDDGEKTRSYVQKRRLEKLSKEVPKET